MDCPHCGKAFHENWVNNHVFSNQKNTKDLARFWHTQIASCPSCQNVIVNLFTSNEPLEIDTRYNIGATIPEADILDKFRVYPQNIWRAPTPKEVPTAIAEDYEEACKVLHISPKASAALSRRCLQAILTEHGYKQRDLAKQIDALLSDPDPGRAITTSLRSTVDAVRNFGNFSAHQLNDLTTLQVIPVEEGEAEWCLDILDDLFDHYYVRPAKAAARRLALNTKLAAAGKPPSKS